MNLGGASAGFGLGSAALSGALPNSFDAAGLTNTRAISDIAGTAPLKVGNPANTTGGAPGDIVLPYGGGVLGANSTGTGTYRLVQLATVGGATNVTQVAAATGLAIGAPSSLSGAAAGDAVIANGAALRSSNAAGTGTVHIANVNASNAVNLGIASIVGIGGPATLSGAAAGDVVIPNASWIRGANNAGTGTVTLIRATSGNALELGTSTTVSGVLIANGGSGIQALSGGATSATAFYLGRNAGTEAAFFIAGAANDYITGAAQADVGISGPTGKTIWFGHANVAAASLTATTFNLANVAGLYAINGTQVVGTRKTGWTAATGTATRTTFATGSVTLPVLAEHVKALIDDLISHGLIGA